MDFSFRKQNFWIREGGRREENDVAGGEENGVAGGGNCGFFSFLLLTIDLQNSMVYVLTNRFNG
jgi:hypothetical protein